MPTVRDAVGRLTSAEAQELFQRRVLKGRTGEQFALLEASELAAQL